MSDSKRNWLDIWRASFKLGLTSFGGPAAHLGYFKNEYVDNKKWLDDKTYADIIALCQFLPGPASSQVGIAIGMLRGGVIGGLISWLGFTIPSVIFLVLCALFYQQFSLGSTAFIHGLKIVAVAVVAHAVLGLGKKLIINKATLAIAIAAAFTILLFPSAAIQLLIIGAAGLLGYIFFQKASTLQAVSLSIRLSKRKGIISLVSLGVLLAVLPLLAASTKNGYVELFDTFFRVGSIVFGGGHVVLPLLEREVVPALMTADQFLAGYGLAQAVPGPLFTFSGYLGTIAYGVIGGCIAVVAIFLPSFLLLIGTLPFFDELRSKKSFQGILVGINASVVGLLLAAFYNPVFTSTIGTSLDFSIALILFCLLQFWKFPAWAVVLVGLASGVLFI